MIKTILPGPLKGALAIVLIVLNTLWLFPVLLFFAILKLILPVRSIRKLCTVILNRIAWLWVGFNNLLADTLHQVKWDVRGAENLSPNQWYFVTCNHQSWADIPERFLGMDYQSDPKVRSDFQRWIGQLWQEKDQRIDYLLRE